MHQKKIKEFFFKFLLLRGGEEEVNMKALPMCDKKVFFLLRLVLIVVE